ncbi:transcriptional regulator [Yeosuana aromativorans]|uniref:Transcriptional regulator n=1 Tax=Yeosuana aromativorans TaxID=288019 RepID=A0A8J3BKJ6_9FLAO|nr:SRPBCC family protein [Yeosuana aromativorans]GGK17689.1 transcriptional regulator [Yeosuana aromativorans]
MKTVKYFLFLFLIIIIGFCVYVAVQPNSFKVSRTRTIHAPASVVYKHVIDFKNWQNWWSWTDSNPDMKIYMSEQTTGVGGSFSWDDTNGVGMIKTTQTMPNMSIEQDMQIADFPPLTAQWNFKDNDDYLTDVTWSISADNLPFTFKMMSVLKGNMETQLGPHLERSLEKLDSVVIADMSAYTITVDGITEHSGGYYIFNSTSCKISDLENTTAELFSKVKQYAEANHISMAGSPFVYYHFLDRENNAAMISCCIPTTSRVITTENDILTGQLIPFKTLKTTLLGDHKNLQEAWKTSMKYITENNLLLDENGPKLETYVVDSSGSPNPADWKTEIYIALKD